MKPLGHPCPRCGREDTATLDVRLWAAPLGTWSLPGVQLKASARPRPVLDCSACGLRHWGEDDGKGYAVFPPVPHEHPCPATCVEGIECCVCARARRSYRPTGDQHP